MLESGQTRLSAGSLATYININLCPMSCVNESVAYQVLFHPGSSRLAVEGLCVQLLLVARLHPEWFSRSQADLDAFATKKNTLW